MASNMHWMILFCRSIEQHTAKLAVGASADNTTCEGGHKRIGD